MVAPAATAAMQPHTHTHTACGEQTHTHTYLFVIQIYRDHPLVLGHFHALMQPPLAAKCVNFGARLSSPSVSLDVPKTLCSRSHSHTCHSNESKSFLGDDGCLSFVYTSPAPVRLAIYFCFFDSVVAGQTKTRLTENHRSMGVGAAKHCCTIRFSFPSR